jgi:hypothetical protein
MAGAEFSPLARSWATRRRMNICDSPFRSRRAKLALGIMHTPPIAPVEVPKDEHTEPSPLANEPYKVESWTDNGRTLDRLLYAGNLQKARSVFGQATKRGRFIRLTIRRGRRVLDEWRPLTIRPV